MGISQRDTSRRAGRGFSHTALTLAIATVLAGASQQSLAESVTKHAFVLAKPAVVRPRVQGVMFVDARVPEPARLARAAAPGTPMVMVDPRRDGLRQVADWLDSHRGATRVALVAHGAPGELQLGAHMLDAGALDAGAATLARIGRAMAPDGELMVYGCNTGAGERGVRFVGTLATLTGHGVAASDDVTGKDGDWDLEVVRGRVEDAPMLGAAVLGGYAHDLATITVTSNADSGPGTLRQAIADAHDGDTITFSSDFIVSLSTHASGDSLLLIDKDLGIDGDLDDNGTPDVVLDGQHNGRVLEIASGASVNLDGLTVENGLLSGDGGGFFGRPGGDALGAGIYVTGATLTITHSSIRNNAASGGGGAGSTVSSYSYTGGGGGGIAGTGGGDGGAYMAGYLGGTGGGGVGGDGGSYYGPGYTSSGKGGSTSGGAGGMQGKSTATYTGWTTGGQGGTAGGGGNAIGGGGGGSGGSGGTAIGGHGGNAAGGMYIASSATVYMTATTVTGNLAAGGGGGGAGGSAGGTYSNSTNGADGGMGVGGIWNKGSLHYAAGSVDLVGTDNANYGAGGAGGKADGWSAHTNPHQPWTGGADGATGAGGNTGGENVTTSDGGTVDSGYALTPEIDSATYDAAAGKLVVTGTDFTALAGAANDIVASKFTFTGEGPATYTLTDTGNVEITSSTGFTLNLGAADKAGVNLVVNKNGTSSTGGTTYNLAAAEDWAAGADTPVVVADTTGNAITVSNVAVPAITSATYDAAAGKVVVTGTGFLSSSGTSNDIVANKFTFTGEGPATYTLTDTGNVEITSGTGFTLNLSAADKAGVNLVVNKNGTSSTGGTTYNLAAAEDWAAGADAPVVVADTTGNGITASNVAVPAITSATYDASTGTVTVTGTGFLLLNGAANDIVADKFTFRGEGSDIYTLTDTADVEIASGTSFTLFLSAADKAAVNLIVNKNGTSSTGGTTYNVAAAEDWAAGADAAVAVADTTGNGVTASNVAVPAITDATYDAATGSLTVTGTGFLSSSGASNDIVADKFTFTGEGEQTYTLTDTANVDIASATSFTLVLSATDKAAIDQIVDENGTSSTGGTTYNLSAAEDWAAGADAAVVVADTTGNGITASHVDATPVVTPSSGTTIFVEGTPVTVDGGLTLGDADSATLVSAIVALTGGFHGGEDVLSFTNDGSTMGNITASYNAGTGVLTLGSAGGAATLAQWQAALRSVSYTDTSDNPDTTARTISFTVNDGTRDSIAVTKSVDVVPVNDAPTLTATPNPVPHYTEGDGAVTLFTGTSISTVEAGQSIHALTLTVGGLADGASEILNVDGTAVALSNGNAVTTAANGCLVAVTVSGGTATVTVTKAGDYSASAAQTLVDGLGYSNASQDPTVAGGRTITLASIQDNGGTANGGVDTSAPGIGETVVLTAVNDAPVVTTDSGSVAFVAGDNAVSTPVAVDGGLTVSDVDNTTLAWATASIAGGFHAGEDVLAFTNDGSTMGNITASYDATTGVLTLNSAGGAATLAQWQAALRSVTYTDTAIIPDTVTRTVSFTVNDGTDDSTVATRTVTVTATGQTPIVTTTGGTTDYVVGAAAVIIDGGVTVSDLDNTTQSSATVSVNAGFHVGDVPGFVNTSSTLFGNIGASYNAATGVMTLTSSGATATNAQWANALSSVTFSSTSTSYGSRMIGFTVNDGVKTSAVATDTVNVLGPAQVTGVGSTTPDGSYKAGDSIDLTVTFDQPVTVNTTGGTPTLVLETGSTDQAAGYISGSGGDTLTFAYVVQAGDVSADLDYASTAALTLNGATIRSNGVDATLTLPATGGANSIAGQHAIVVDGIAPTVVFVDVPPDAVYGLGQNLDFTVDFSEHVMVDTAGGTPRLAVTLNTGGTVYADYLSGSGTTTLVFRMTVIAGELDLDGITMGAALDANGGTLRDPVGNDAESALVGVPDTSGIRVDSRTAQLALGIDDARDYARYGRMQDYVVTVDNDGDADAVGVDLSVAFSPGLVADVAQWQCFGGGSPAVAGLPHCVPASGTGVPASVLDLPPGASLSFLVSVPVDVAAAGTQVQVDASVSDSGNGTPLDASDSDSDTLVLFRDGFDVPYADGTQALPSAAGTALAAPTPCAGDDALNARGTVLFELPPRLGDMLIDTLYAAHAADGTRVAVQRLNLDSTPWLRLFSRGGNGDRASAWTAARPGTTLALGLGEGGDKRWLLLEGKQASLRLPLPADGDAAGGACR